MGYTNSQVNTDAARDAINPQMRASALWRDAIRGMGLNPDGPLNLSKAQQQMLAQAMGLPNDVHIDQAGNINDFHGWKGLPTAAKVGIVGGAAALTAGAAGAFGGGAAAGAAGAGTGVGTGTAAGVGAGAAGVAGAAGGFWTPATIGLLSTGIGAGTNLIGAKMQTNANNRALAMQNASNADSLAFLKEQDARDHAEYLAERQRLWGNEDVDRAHAEEGRQLLLKREGEREGRLTPFREGAANGYKQLSSLLTVPPEGITYRPQRPQLADLVRG